MSGAITDICVAHEDAPPGCPYAAEPVVPWMPVRILLYLAAFLAVELGAGYLIALGLGAGHLVAGLGEEAFRKFLFPAGVAAAGLGIGVTALFWRAIDRRSLAGLGLARHAGVPAEAARGILAAMWLMTLASVPALISGRAAIQFLPDGAGAFLRTFVLYAGAFLIVAFNEEMAFRGYILRNLLFKVRPWVALVIHGVLFAAMHATNPHVTPLALVNLALAGTFLALTVFRWNSLWYAVAFHFAWNFYQSVILSLPVSGMRVAGLLSVPAAGPDWLTGGAFGPEGGLMVTLLLLAAGSRLLAGNPVRMTEAPQPPPCADGEPCPLIPPEIHAALERDRARQEAAVSPGSGEGAAGR